VAKLVCIDPGHGGRDPGAVGNGLKEMEVVLAISERIEKALKRDWDVEVFLTRRDNETFLELSERAQLANTRNATAFLAVHINSAPAAAAPGVESYRHTAAGEGSPSARLQAVLHAAVYGALRKHGVTDRREKAANFAVLRLTTMPAVLTENLFISNAQDAALLKQPSVINEIAEAHAFGLGRALGLPPKDAEDVHRVIADGVKVGSYREDENVGKAVVAAIRSGAKRVEVVEIDHIRDAAPQLAGVGTGRELEHATSINEPQANPDG
jgi:N-acetylmuramoyl-L-alanine amidase